MTEVQSVLPPDHRLATVKHYEAGPPEGLELVEPGDTFATTKEEEWVSKKKTEVLNTKQIETRVKRQVVLEDGKVVEDSGPMVSTNTTEDTETQEHHQTELRKLGGDTVDGQPAVEGGTAEDRANWISVPNPDGVVREVKERRVVSREETEEVKETEDVQHLGDITDEEFLSAVRSGKSDLRDVIRSSEAGRTLVSTGPRIVHESVKSNKVTDTEDTRELSSVRPDGKIVTETQRTTEHEEIKDDELPEDAPEQNFHKETSERYLKTREQQDVDYLADGVNIGHEMRFKTETMEVERRGDGLDEPDFDSLSARARRRSNNRPPHRYRGITDWSERRQEQHCSSDRRSPMPPYIPEIRRSPIIDHIERRSPIERQRSPVPDYRIAPERPERIERFNGADSPEKYERVSRLDKYDRYEYHDRVERIDRDPHQRASPIHRKSPTPPQRKRTERKPQRVIEEPPSSRYNSYRSSSRMERQRDEPLEEPPPDYLPPSPPPMPPEKKPVQKTRFAETPPKAKGGNIIGQSIRKLVGKIRSASAERKAKQRAKRSPSPSYQPGHIIDNNIGHHGMENGRQPVQRYYLGEDPFAGSIYGRENKYDGVKPARSSRKPREDEKR